MKTCSIEGCNEKHYGKGLCEKHYWKQYRIENREDCLEREKRHRVNNKEKRANSFKQWSLEHKEERTKYKKQYCQDNKEQIAEYGKQYNQKNRKQIAKQAKKYNQTPAGKASNKAHCSNRRALTKSLTLAIVQRVYDDNIKKHGILICCLCDKPIAFGDDSLEHLTPLTREGTNKYNNLGIAHVSCNKRKGTMTLEEWNEKEKDKKS